MGFLNRILTGKRSESDGVQQLRKASAELESRMDQLSDRLDELHSEHRKLRGRFYAARGEVEAPAQSREDLKRAALARVGYIPGRPAPHKE